MNIPIKIRSVLAAALLLTLCLAACEMNDAPATLTDAPETASDEAELWLTAPPETLGVAVETPYLTLHYPQELADVLEVESTDIGANRVTAFYAEIAGQHVALFSVTVGTEEADGYLLGRLTDDANGTVNVYTDVFEYDRADWSAEDYENICALQERINDVIYPISQDERFVPNR